MDRYAVIGYPVKHSRSPFIHALFAKQCEQAMSYGMLETPPEQLTQAVQQFFAQGGKGLNVTVPYKQQVMSALTYYTPRAEFAGAVNTILRREDGTLMGDNTDGVGLLKDLNQNLKFELHNKRVLMLGAGGAARGALAPLLQQHPELLVIANRNVERAQQLVQEFHALGNLQANSFEQLPDQSFDLIINATSASLQGDMPPLPAHLIRPDTLCYDMAYGQRDTVFIAWAKRQGATQAVQGWGMLVEQAAEAFYLWRGVHPDTLPVLVALQNPPPPRVV